MSHFKQYHCGITLKTHMISMLICTRKKTTFWLNDNPIELLIVETTTEIQFEYVDWWFGGHSHIFYIKILFFCLISQFFDWLNRWWAEIFGITLCIIRFFFHCFFFTFWLFNVTLAQYRSFQSIDQFRLTCKITLN